jgi:NADPH2:quinone reductase
MTDMRAAWYERTGPADAVIEIGRRPMPEPGPGEVRVRLMASGVNPADCNRRRGQGHAMEAPLVVPNSDGAGTIDRIGEGVTRFRAGDRVWLYNGQRNGRHLGTAAEFIALDADLVTPLPASVPFAAGACLGIPCMTAHRCIFSRGPVSGQTLLVTGGGGAVGNYAIQLAVWAGARVIATVSHAVHAEDARRAGADVVIDRHREDVAARVLAETGGRGVERIVEVDFGGNLSVARDIVAVNGVIAAYASKGAPSPVVPFADLMRRNIAVEGVMLPTSPIAARRQAQSDILRWLESGERLHRIAAAFPLAETAKAHLAVEAGAKRGTVVVEPCR